MSSKPAPEATPAQQYPSDREVDAVLEEFGQDARAAIAALLHDLAALADDRESNVSRGFVRGRRVKLIGRDTPA